MKTLVSPMTRLRSRRTQWAAAICLASAWMLMQSALASATPLTTIAISPSPKTALVGDAFSLDLSIANVNDLFDYQVDLNFNPAILQANGVIDGGFLTSDGGTSIFSGPFVLTLDNTTGLVTILDSLTGPVPPASGVTGAGILASINFTALAPGASGVSLANLILEDSNGNPIDAQTVDGRVLVNAGATPVPEPATLCLLGSGLVVGLRRARSRRLPRG